MLPAPRSAATLVRAARTLSSTSIASSSFSSSSASSSSSSSSSGTAQSRITTHYVPPPPPAYSDEKTHFLIQLVRSPIGLTKDKQGTLDALGLKKRHRWVMREQHPSMVGQILNIKELVKVKNVTLEEGEELLRRYNDRSEDSGVAPAGFIYGGGRAKGSLAK